MDYALSGIRISRGHVALPSIGAWSASLGLLASEAPSGKVTLTSSTGLSLVGTVKSGDFTSGVVMVQVVGGAGGLHKTVEPKSYRNVPARIPLTELLTEAGETLSSTSDAAVLSKQLTHWVRKGDEAGQALAALVASLGATWRILPDGSVWIGTDTWPAAPTFEGQELIDDPSSSTIKFSTSSIPNLLPGTTVDGRKIAYVEHFLESGGARTEVYFDASSGDRMLSALWKLVRRAFARVDYYAVRAAKVVSQAADGSLDLVPDDPTFKHLQRVPIRYGVPGVRAKVPNGTRCLFTFEGGKPEAPIVVGWETGADLELILGDSTGRGVARQGDIVSLTMPPVIPMTGTVGGSPFVGTITLTTPVVGTIITGSGRVKAAS